MPTDSDAINGNTVTGVNSLHMVTVACLAILQTQLVAPTPKPAWFDGLNASLDAAKKLATQWKDEFAVDLTSTIPDQVTNYGTTYTALTKQIAAIANANPNAQGKDNPAVQQVFQLVSGLESELQKILKNVDDVAARLTTWGDQMQKAHDDLFNGATNIQAAETDLNTDITNMNIAIDGLHAEIDGLRKIILGMQISVGVGIFGMVAGLAFGLATFGAGFVVAGISTLAVAGSAAAWGVLQGKVDAKLGTISTDLDKISDDKKQIVTLTALALATNGAVSSIALATNALVDVRTMWAGFGKDIKGTSDKLKKADQGLALIVNEAWVNAAAAEWDLAVKFAQSIETDLPVVTKTLTIPAAA